MDDIRRALRSTGDGMSVHLERSLPHPPVDVWSACTEIDRLRRWLGEVTGQARLAGTVVLAMSAQELATCRIQRCEPPHVLAVSWSETGHADAEVELTLSAVPGGTRLVLEHRGAAESELIGYGAGWEDFVDQLAEHLSTPDGSVTTHPWAEVEQRLGPTWAAVRTTSSSTAGSGA